MPSYFLLIIVLSIKNIKANSISYVDVVEGLSTFSLLDGLQSTLKPGTTCFHDINEYAGGLSSYEPWALKMFDSSAQVPNGLLLQNNMFLGHFDECVEVHHPDGNFAGQHCMLDVYIDLWNRSIIPTSRIFEYENPTKSTLEFKIGICLPSSCSPTEINIALTRIFYHTQKYFRINVKALENNCQGENSSLHPSPGIWIAVIFLVFIIVIALSSTCYDVYQRHALKKDSSDFFLASFSIYTNSRKLFTISKTSDQLEIINGMRVFSTCWVILLHAYLGLVDVTRAPAVDHVGAHKRILDTNHTIILNGFLAVDTFLFLSGLLISLAFFRDITKKGYYDAPLGYIHRYIRLTPPYAVMMLITATIFPYLGNGPIWLSTVSDASQECRRSWWLGLLYITNFFSSEHHCLRQSWYLSLDMQLHWISPIILYPVFLWPSLARSFLCVVILGAAIIPFTIARANNLGPSLLIKPQRFQGQLDYAPFYTRAAPYLIGIALGYVIYTIQAKQIQINLSKLWVSIGWATSTGLCLGSLYGIARFTNVDFTTLEAAFYLAFHRVGWGLGLAWIVFTCAHGYGGPANAFLSWNVFQPLGKLSYCTYLVHMTFQYYRVGISRTNIYGNDYEMLYLALGDIVVSFLAAVPMTLLLEMPYRNIYRYIFRYVKILPFPKERKKMKKIEPEKNSNNIAENGKITEMEQFM